MREAVAAFFVVGTDSQSRAATVMEKKKGASSRQIRELRWHAAAQDEIKQALRTGAPGQPARNA